jgi:hypothetical protein
MNKLPTAEEWLTNHKELFKYSLELHDEGGYLGIDDDMLYKIMNEYAKLHVKACKKEISEKAKLNDFAYEFLQEAASDAIDKDSILNAYSLDLIK